MKKIFTVSFALLISVCLMAQGPTLTSSSSAPVVGDMISVQNANAGGVAIPNMGAGVTWDYSALIDTVGSSTITYIPAAGTPWIGGFPAANLAVLSIPGQLDSDSTYYYYDSNSSNFIALGDSQNHIYSGGSSAHAVVYSQGITQMHFPFSNGSTFYGSFSGYETGFVSGQNFLLSGVDSSWAIGYGTLELPMQTFNNVLLVKTIYDQDITANGGSVFINETSFSFYVPGYHEALLTITNDSTNFFGPTIFSKSAKYATNAPSGIAIVKDTQANLSVCPMPAKDKIQIRLPGTSVGYTVEVYNTIGEKIMSFTNQTTLDISTLTPGVYFIRATNGDKTFSGKFIKE